MVEGYTTNDTNIEYGETIDLILELSNIGTESAIALVLFVTSEDPYVNILNGNIGLGNLEAGQMLTTQFIEVEISANIPDGHNFTLNCDFSKN